jgi:hypothetical protein
MIGYNFKFNLNIFRWNGQTMLQMTYNNEFLKFIFPILVYLKIGRTDDDIIDFRIKRTIQSPTVDQDESKKHEQHTIKRYLTTNTAAIRNWLKHSRQLQL